MKTTALICHLLLLSLFLIPSDVISQEFTKEIVAEGLKNPCGLAIQPETGHIFLTDSGHFKVIRIAADKQEDVITDFPKGVYQNGETFDVGPMGLLFLDKNRLLVGDGGRPGKDAIRVFEVPAEGADPITADSSQAKLDLSGEGQIPAEGNFYSMAKTPTAAYITGKGDETKGWIAQCDISGNQISNLRRAIATRELVGIPSPTAITISPEGFLAVGQIGKPNEESDSELAFFETDGKFLQSFKTGLKDMVGIAYGPKRGRLFAIDFNAQQPESSGLYKIVADGKNKCKAIQIMNLDQPSSIAFAPNGDLYVTLFGPSNSSADAPSGSLIRIKGLDEETKKK